MPAKVFLQVISGPIKGKVFEFADHDTFVFGRGKECHATLPDDGYVSRHHFLLEVSPPAAIVRDLRSLNGTHINGVRYGGRKPAADGSPPQEFQAAVKDRDVIMVGKTRIRVRVVTPQKKQGSKARSPSPAKPPGAELYVPTATESADKAARSALARSGASPVPGRDQDSRPSSFPNGKAEPLVPPSSVGDGSVEPAVAAQDDAGGLRALIRHAAKDFQALQKVEVEGFELGEIIGQGGMGVVYKAVRKLDHFPAAVKVMLAKVAVHDKARQRFLREIGIVRELNHPNVVALLASGAVENAFYFVMEYCNGGSLAELACRQAAGFRFRSSRRLSCKASRGWPKLISRDSSIATSSRQTSFSTNSRAAGQPSLAISDWPSILSKQAFRA